MSERNEHILELRSKGLSYRKISERLGIPIGTVKSTCSRGSGKALDGRCRQCGKTLAHHPGKKRKEFCSDACRWRWHREHDRKGE